MRDITGRVPMGRFASPDDVARAIAFLADERESAFVNGHALSVDGGWAADGSWESLRLSHGEGTDVSPQSPVVSAPRCRPVDTAGLTSVNLPYQTRQAFTGIIGWPVLHPKAWPNSGMFWTTPLTRNSRGECGSVCTCSRTCSGRMLPHQFCP